MVDLVMCCPALARADLPAAPRPLSPGSLSHLAVTVGVVEVHQLEVHCACGAVWSLYVDEDPDDGLEVECIGCGATVVDVRDLGPLHSPAATSNRRLPGPDRGR